MTLYAKWSAIPVYTVTFYSDGGSNVDAQYIMEGNYVTEPADPVLTEHVFQGWFSDGDLTVLWDFTSDAVTSNLTLFAKWQINQYTVTFDSRGGSIVQSQLVDYNDFASPPTDPVKNGYAITGWFENTELSDQWIFAADKVTTDVTLYAGWTINPGSQDTLTADGVSFKMNIVPGGLTYPKGIADDTTTTVSNAYWIAEIEVTYELWYKVYTWATGGSGAPGAGQYTFANTGQPGNDGTPGTEITSQEPVTCINWRDAMIWCNALTEWYNAKNGTNYTCAYYTDNIYENPIRTATATFSVPNPLVSGEEDQPYILSETNGNISMGNCTATGFRLLTSDEWELAARYRGSDSTNTVQSTIDTIDFANPIDGIYWTKGNSASGSTTYFNNITSGSGEPALSDYEIIAVFSGVYDGSVTHPTGVTGTAEVKSKIANTLGLYDMSGNVEEWFFDWLPASTTFRMYRSGNWNSTSYDTQIGLTMRRTNPYGIVNYLGLRFTRTEYE